MKFTSVFCAVAVVLFGVCLVLSSGCTGDRGGDLKSKVQESDLSGSDISGKVSDNPELQEIEEKLLAIAEVWAVSDVACEGNTCTAVLESENGDKAVIAASVYLTKAEAQNAYDAEKGQYSGFKMVEIDAGDEAYAWTERRISQVGVIKANAVVIVDFETPGGIGGSFTEAKELAEEVESVLAEYQ
ncbi:hypothetical protein [Methanoplanus endosymbiosus]|uniref:Uncharacterized protein n=1 Tax=Methanoplanus endosymbiosus TaxID=33865 RepID=A0A9E7TGJ7_9EURY|nr:hypothetical protein [Methanoplanus endosymbiosus]UUX91272.1 hypothetical protein L6E24_07735 [Methanoplanus endosymbiosus]